MFADIEADIYVLVDGDATYDAASAPAMIKLLLDNQLDMVNGARVTDIEAAYRPGHRFGNWLLTSMVAWIFGNRFKDMLSGYRIFSRRYVKSFPALAVGFETETELTVHALELRMPTDEVSNAVQGATRRLDMQAQHLQRRLPHFVDVIVLSKEERPISFSR
jgi:hypothetical protein